MKNIIITFLVLLIPFLSFSQKYDQLGNWGVGYKRLKADTSFISLNIATFGGGPEDFFNAYPINVYGQIKTSSIKVDSFGAPPGSGNNGYSILMNKGAFYAPPGNTNFITNSARGIRDASTVTILNSGAGYASFDSNPSVFGDTTGNVDHMVSFQARPVFDYPVGSTMNDMFGVWSLLTPKRGSLTNAYDYYASHLGPTGSPATVNNHYGLFVEDFSASPTAANNYGIWVDGATMHNYLAGTLTTDSTTKVNSKLIAKRIGVGTDNPTADASVQALTGDTGIVTIEGGYPSLKLRWQFPSDSSEFSLFMDNQVYFKITEAGNSAYIFSHGTSSLLRLRSDNGLGGLIGTAGISNPRARLEITAGNGVTAPLIINPGSLLGDAAAHSGTIQNDGNYLYYTNNGLNRGKIEVNKVLVSSAGTLTLGNVYNIYVFSGTTTTWTLPAVTGTKDIVYYIKNRGSGAITLNTTAAANEIYTTAATNTITINAGQAVEIASDGTFWNLLNQH